MRAPSDIRSIAELLEKVQADEVSHGSTVEVSMANPELQTEADIGRAVDLLNAHGLRLLRKVGFPPSHITIHPPV